MLNLVMTHSPRIAAMTNNKRYGEDAIKDPAVLHRMAWLRKPAKAARPAAYHSAEQALHERIA